MTRSCSGTTKAGKPCKAHPLSDRDVCLAHADEETRVSTNFQQGPRPGRPRVPRATELQRQLVEENAIAVQRPYWRTLGFDVVLTSAGPKVIEVEGGGAKIYGVSAKDGVVYVSEHDDLGAMVTASEKLQDRAFGRPKQTQEISGPDGTPVQVALPSESEWHAQVAGALAEAGALDAGSEE